MHEEQAASGSLVREHDIGPGGSVVVAVEADDVRVRGVDGTTVRLVAPTPDHPAIEVVAEPEDATAAEPEAEDAPANRLPEADGIATGLGHDLDGGMVRGGSNEAHGRAIHAAHPDIVRLDGDDDGPTRPNVVLANQGSRGGLFLVHWSASQGPELGRRRGRVDLAAREPFQDLAPDSA